MHKAMMASALVCLAAAGRHGQMTGMLITRHGRVLDDTTYEHAEFSPNDALDRLLKTIAH